MDPEWGLKPLDAVYTDDEASLPEWVDLMTQIDETSAKLRKRADTDAERFANEPDVKRALADRERSADGLRTQAEKINSMVRRLNLISPLSRFQRSPIDADELVKPLYRVRRQNFAGGTLPSSPGVRGPGTPPKR